MPACLAKKTNGAVEVSVVAATLPISANELLARTDGVASIGVGLFGVVITVFAFRSRARWAWYALWFLPHLLAGPSDRPIAAWHGPDSPGRVPCARLGRTAAPDSRVLPAASLKVTGPTPDAEAMMQLR